MKIRASLVVAVLAACGSVASPSPSPSPTIAALPSASPAVSFVPVSTPNPSPSPTSSSRTVTFRDPLNGNSLAIEVAANAPDRGHFAFAVPSGVYGGPQVRAALSGFSATIAVSYEGAIEFIDTASGTKRSTSVVLRGTIDPDAHAADVVFTADGMRYVITARPPDVGSLPRILDRMESALIADDPAALYTVTTKAVREQYTQSQFVSAWQSQAATTGRRITAMRRVSVGTVVESDLGFASVEVRYSADVNDRNGSHVTAYLAFFVFEDGEWRLFTTSEN